jgi:predicted nucleic acid-binding protein
MICIDASVAAKWVFIEEDSDLARAAFRGHEDSGIIAPAFMPAEVTNSIRRRVARGLMTNEEGERALDLFLSFEVTLSIDAAVHVEALRLAHRYGRPAAYHMHYVALAQIAGCDLWTADERLLNAVGGRLGFVKPLSVYKPNDR